jgi:hypothetical protein
MTIQFDELYYSLALGSRAGLTFFGHMNIIQKVKVTIGEKNAKTEKFPRLFSVRT